MFQKSAFGLILILTLQAASADDLGIIVAKPHVNLPTGDTLSAMSDELGVEGISISTAKTPQEYLERFEALQHDGASSVLTLGADYLAPGLLAGLHETRGLRAGVRRSLLDLPSNLTSGEYTDLYVVLPAGKPLERALSSAWLTPIGDEALDFSDENSSWIASGGPTAQELWNMGFFSIGDDSSGGLFLYGGNTSDDDGCGCEDSELAPYMTCDPDGASWSAFADYLSSKSTDDDGCGGECEGGRFVPYSEFQTSKLYSELVSDGWPSTTVLNDLSSAGELIYVFTCDPD